MAIHSGDVDVQEDHYFGPALYRADLVTKAIAQAIVRDVPGRPLVETLAAPSTRLKAGRARPRQPMSVTCGPPSIGKRASVPSRSRIHACPVPCARRPSHDRTPSGSGP